MARFVPRLLAASTIWAVVACQWVTAIDDGAIAGDCPRGFERCSNVCADLERSPIHCGVCFRPCAPGDVCVNGQCVCAIGLTRCGDVCVQLQSNINHCGACGERCTSGACCLGQCVDLSSDEKHCGGCVHACPVSWKCVAGICQVLPGDGGMDAGSPDGAVDAAVDAEQDAAADALADSTTSEAAPP